MHNKVTITKFFCVASKTFLKNVKRKHMNRTHLKFVSCKHQVHIWSEKPIHYLASTTNITALLIRRLQTAIMDYQANHFFKYCNRVIITGKVQNNIFLNFISKLLKCLAETIFNYAETIN